MDNDDRMIGRILSRRQILRTLGLTAGSATLAGLAGCNPVVATVPQPPGGAGNTGSSSGLGSGLPGCVVRPALTEGPYFVDEKLNRSDIRSNQDSSIKSGEVSVGVPLRIKFLVSTVGSSCSALLGVQIDVWHCDASGKYSDESANSTVGQNFLRGYQVTDSTGIAEFLTVYPGWYQGRAVHIHFKLRANSGGKAYQFTSQLFFDETVTDTVHALVPYASKGYRTIKNTGDGIYNNGGNQLLLTTSKVNDEYQATFDIGVNLPV